MIIKINNQMNKSIIIAALCGYISAVRIEQKCTGPDCPPLTPAECHGKECLVEECLEGKCKGKECPAECENCEGEDCKMCKGKECPLPESECILGDDGSCINYTEVQDAEEVGAEEKPPKDVGKKHKKYEARFLSLEEALAEIREQIQFITEKMNEHHPEEEVPTLAQEPTPEEEGEQEQEDE